MTPFFSGFLRAVALVAFLLALLAMSACAAVPEYINASPEERTACAAAPGGCTVWTEAELKQFAAGMFKAGFERGVKHERSSL